MTATSPSSTPKVAFFGATGGSALAALVKTLKAEIPCSVLVRNPEKLDTLLQRHDLSSSSPHLIITKGDIKDIDAVKATLTANNQCGCVPLIISGIGSLPTLQASIWRPVTLITPGICADFSSTIIQAVEELDCQTKPFVSVLSTTGLSKRRDVPILFLALYHWLLAVPHEDKAIMEGKLTQEAARKGSVFSGLVVARPSLLVDSAARGLDRVRVGWEQSDESANASAPGPAIGYTISRQDVGDWIYTRIIAADDAMRAEWAGRMVTLTY